MSIPTLRANDKGVYYIHWSEGGRSKRNSTGTKSLDEAKTFLGQWLLMTSQAPTSTDNAAALTISDLWDVYYKKYVLIEVASIDSVDSIWKNLASKFGNKRVTEIDQDLVDEYEADRRKGRIGRKSVGSTVRRELVALRACLNFCAGISQRNKKQRQISKPLIRPGDLPTFGLPDESKPRDRWHSVDEIEKLHAAARAMRRGKRMSRSERFLWLALETGARAGAILDLTWDRVDFENGVIHFENPDRRQTKKRRSSVPMSAKLRTVLEQAYVERLNKNSDDGLVMDSPSGMWRSVQNVAKRAGIARTYPHAMRHTAGTQMARNGVPLWKVSKVLGNSLQIVEKVYAKHAPDDLRDSVAVISGVAKKTEPEAEAERILRAAASQGVDLKALLQRMEAAE